MKRNKFSHTSRFFALLLAVCMTVSLVPAAWAVGETPESGAVYEVTKDQDIREIINKANAGDTIKLTEDYEVQPLQSDDPWIINKSVTITGQTLYLRCGGIVLDADVTFENINISMGNPLRNAIMANGHTLTLKDVSCVDGGRPINLFCGGLYKFSEASMPEPGNHGKIVLEGKVDLESSEGTGNIYAGNLCRGKKTVNDAANEDGPENIFDKPAEIVIEATGDIGDVYACGAQKRVGDSEGNDGVQSEGITPNVEKYKVSGAVTVTIQSGVYTVYGKTGGDSNAFVKINRDNNLYEPALYDISNLAVERGNVKPTAESNFSNGAAVSVTQGATLNLAEMDKQLTVGDFSGCGTLVLGEKQKLTINGQVGAGTTNVGIGGVFNNVSEKLLTEGQVYITAQDSEKGSFVLIPPDGQPTMKLIRDANGNWKARKDGEPKILVKQLGMEDTSVPHNAIKAEMPFHVEYEEDSDFYVLDHPQLKLSIGGTEMTEKKTDGEADGLVYVAEELGIEIEVFSDLLEIKCTGASFANSTYQITATVPAKHTKGGADITSTATLTVLAEGELVPVDIPAGKTNLVYNGKEQVGVEERPGYYTLEGTSKATNAGTYTATAKLKEGYQWKTETEGEKRTDKPITWSIAKAPAAPKPSNLKGYAPTAENKTDGRITGVTQAMEYSVSAGFSGAKDCTGTEVTGLAPGTYYVRIKAGKNYETAGESVSVTVPRYQEPETNPPETPDDPTVTEIEISSTSYKTAYTVGDSLDVTNLTLKVTKSDGATETVTVTEDMVTGFNSTQPAESQTLTVTYGGKTVRYTIKITAKDTETPSGKYKVTVEFSQAAESGAGEYAPGDSVTVHAGTRSGYTFGGWAGVTGITLNDSDKKKADVTFTMPAAHVAMKALWVSDSAAKQYRIYLDDPARGDLTADVSSAAAGDTVTLRIRPDSGYELYDLWITDRWDDEVRWRDAGSDRYTFTMPASDVDVEVEFRRTDSGYHGSSGSSSSSNSTSSSNNNTRTPVPAPAINVPSSAQPAPRAAAGAQTFRDIPTSHWAAGEIAWAQQRGYMNGVGGGAFRPNGTVTNQQLWMVLSRVFGNSSANMASATVWARQNGLATGKNPEGLMSREEMVNVLYRSAFLLGADTSRKANLSAFKDGGAVSASSQDAMAWALANGILNGTADNRLNPGGTVTRAEFSVILYRFCSCTGR